MDTMNQKINALEGMVYQLVNTIKQMSQKNYQTNSTNAFDTAKSDNNTINREDFDSFGKSNNEPKTVNSPWQDVLQELKVSNFSYLESKSYISL